MAITRCLAMAMAACSIPAFCQPVRNTPSRLEFEVATVKPSEPGGRGGGIRPMAGGQTYVATNVPVKLMIKLMFHLSDDQISGGPGWLDSDLYDVRAKAERPSSIEDLHVMFQNLLIERFRLQFHTERKELPAFYLVVDKSGPKMKRNESATTFDFPVKGGGFGRMIAARCSMSYFAWFLAQQLRRPVFDKTQLEGFYDFDLAYAPEPPPNIPPEALVKMPEAPGPELPVALRQQLGLRLESRKGPVEVMVIDGAERPAGN